MRATLVSLALATGIAHAQSPPSAAAADAALTEGRRLCDVRASDKAIAKLKEAYTLPPDAPSPFNLAQSYRLAVILEMEECAKTQAASTPPVTEPSRLRSSFPRADARGLVERDHWTQGFARAE